MFNRPREIKPPPEQEPKPNVVSGHTSIFDDMPTDPAELEKFKEECKPKMKGIIDAKTAPELYMAAQEIITSLPDTDDVGDMITNIMALEIPVKDEKSPTPTEFLAFTIIERDIQTKIAVLPRE